MSGRPIFIDKGIRVGSGGNGEGFTQWRIRGQAAGVAAALAAATETRPRDVAVSAIQRELLGQRDLSPPVCPRRA